MEYKRQLALTYREVFPEFFKNLSESGVGGYIDPASYTFVSINKITCAEMVPCGDESQSM